MPQVAELLILATATVILIDGMMAHLFAFLVHRVRRRGGRFTDAEGQTRPDVPRRMLVTLAALGTLIAIPEVTP